MTELEQVQGLFWRRPSKGDLWSIERKTGLATGGGQNYILLPKSLDPHELFTFFRREGEWNPKDRPAHKLTAAVLGDPDTTGTIPFMPRGEASPGVYRIANQNHHRGGIRHPAWTPAHGFPTLPNEAAAADYPHLRIFIVQTKSAYYAGWVNSEAPPAEWPKSEVLQQMFTTPAGVINGIDHGVDVDEVPTLVYRIVDAWRRKKPNVLLYGPPGTGKTHAMNVLRQLLEGGNGPSFLFLDPTDATSPFVPKGGELPFPTPTKSEWLTFHQSYSYEEFVLGLRPQPATGGGLELKPRAGVLLNAVLSLDPKLKEPPDPKPSDADPKSAVLFIDEVNRGNVSRVFGDFLTFMESDYRAEAPGTPVNPRAIPVPFPQLAYEGDESEPIGRRDGPDVRLPVGWRMPHHLYLLASMNSVDRAVAPLDSALRRRFYMLQVGPDLKLLATKLGVDPNELEKKKRLTKLRSAVAEALAAKQVSEEVAQELELEPGELDEEPDEADESGDEVTALPADPVFSVPLAPREAGWLLLHRLNYLLSREFGPDFELGQTYLRPLWKGSGPEPNPMDLWLELARVWDESIFPHLQELGLSRPRLLFQLLKVPDNDKEHPNYLFCRRRPHGAKRQSDAALERVSLTERWFAGERDRVRLTLCHLSLP